MLISKTNKKCYEKDLFFGLLIKPRNGFKPNAVAVTGTSEFLEGRGVKQMP